MDGATMPNTGVEELQNPELQFAAIPLPLPLHKLLYVPIAQPLRYADITNAETPVP